MANLFAFDIGNSDVVVGQWDGNHWLLVQRIPTRDSLEDPNVFKDHLRIGKDLAIDKELDEVVVSSVVPDMTEIVMNEIKERHAKKPFLIDSNAYDVLEMEIDRPEEIGTDLVANAVAAYNYFGSQVLVVDFGTALTFTLVDKTGAIDGVAIFPGVKTAINSLAADTAQLPEVQLEIPESISGKNTVHAIQSGIMFGFSSVVEGMIRRFEEERGPSKVVSTGGLSEALGSLHDFFDHIDPHLTLEGMRLIYERNRK